MPRTIRLHPLTAPIAITCAVVALSLHTSNPETWGVPMESSVPAQIQEDDPRWDCTTMGNRECGTASAEESATAWEVWDYSEGARKLRMDPSRPFRVVYVGRTSSVPNTDTGEVALIGKDGNAYLFRAVYTDTKES